MRWSVIEKNFLFFLWYLLAVFLVFSSVTYLHFVYIELRALGKREAGV